MRPEYEVIVIGDESTGRGDYAIKVSEVRSFITLFAVNYTNAIFLFSGCRERYLHHGGQTTAECNRRIRSEYQTAREFV